MASTSRFHELLQQLAAEFEKVHGERAPSKAAPAKGHLPLPGADAAHCRITSKDPSEVVRPNFGDTMLPQEHNIVVTPVASPRTAPPADRRLLRQNSRTSSDGMDSTGVLSSSITAHAFWVQNTKSNFYLNNTGVPVRASSGNKRDKASPQPLRLDERWIELHLLNERIADENMQKLHKKVEMGRRLSQATIPSIDLEQLKEPSMSQKLVRSICKTCKVLHPLSTPRLIWDCLGLFLVSYDVLMIPIIAAWTWPIDGGDFIDWMFKFGLSYWMLDIIMTFITARYENGELTFDKATIARWYVRHWLFFDLGVLGLDWFILFSQNLVQDGPVKLVLYAVRMLRLVRVVKFSSLSRTLEDTCIAKGKQHLVLVFAVLKILLTILSVAHILACVWFFVGFSGREEGLGNWLDLLKLGDEIFFYQYLKSLHWVITQFTPSTYPGLLPANIFETAYAIFVILFTMALVGSQISKMIGTINQLNALTSEHARMERQLQLYLTLNKVPLELSQRIQRYVQNALRTRTKIVEKPQALGMIPQTLHAELTMAQMGRNFTIHPFFSLLVEARVEVLNDLWGKFKNQSLEIEEVVFAVEQPVRCMYWTVQGQYRLVMPEGLGFHPKTICEPTWFAEAGLFTTLRHASTLTAVTFGEVFTLAPADFADSMKKSPLGSVALFEYAQAFLRRVRDSHAQYGDGGSLFVLDMLPVDLSSEATEATELAEVLHTNATGRPPVSLRHQEPRGGVAACTPISLAEPAIAFIRRVLERQLRDEETLDQLEQHFPEIRQHGGTYRNASLMEEREHAQLAMMSALWLLRNDYHAMVQCQTEKKLSKDSWEQLQAFVRWINLSDELIHAALVLLAIRGLGKASRFRHMCPPGPCRRTPESAVIYAMRELQQLLPSVTTLDNWSFELVCFTLSTNVDFNFAQMMQGENVPSSVQHLREYARSEGEVALKFYLFTQACMMCGLSGKPILQGSSFLNEPNGRMLLLGLQCLQQVHDDDPLVLYWRYVRARADILNQPHNTPEDLAFARFLCLTRTVQLSDLPPLREVWNELSTLERKVFVEWFLKDGVNESAFIFKFLPLYLTNARQNAAVGLHQAVITLLELIERLLEMGCMQEQTHNITVDISDLAAIVASVRVPQALQKCLDEAKYIMMGDKVSLVMTSKSWRHATAVSSFKKNSSSDDILVISNPESIDFEPRMSVRSLSSMATSRSLPASPVGTFAGSAAPSPKNGVRMRGAR